MCPTRRCRSVRALVPPRGPSDLVHGRPASCPTPCAARAGGHRRHRGALRARSATLMALGSGQAARALSTRSTASQRHVALLEGSGGTADIGPDPGRPDEGPQECGRNRGRARRAQRDGAAMARFLHWLDPEAPQAEAHRDRHRRGAEAFRRETGMLKDVSLRHISGAGRTARSSHYRVTRASNRDHEAGSFLDRFRRAIPERHHRCHPHGGGRRADAEMQRPLHPRPEGPIAIATRVSRRHVRRADRRSRAAALAGRARLRPRHRPRRRQLSSVHEGPSAFAKPARRSSRDVFPTSPATTRRAPTASASRTSYWSKTRHPGRGTRDATASRR